MAPIQQAAAGKPKIFYGWVLVGLAVSVFAVMDGAVYYIFGVYLGPMADDMGWSRGSTSAAFSLFVVVMGLSGPLIALRIDRFGVRRFLLLGGVLIVAAFLLMSRVAQMWHLYLIYGLMVGFGRACASYMAVTHMLNNWFSERKSLVMGIAISGSGLGTMAMAPISRYLIDTVGWRDSWMVLSGVVFAFALLPSLLLARNRPEDVGLQPYSLPALPADEKKPRRRVRATTIDWGMGAAARTAAFWLIAFVVCAKYFALQMMTTHQVVHLGDLGIAPLVAASALGLLILAGSGGMLLMGTVGQWMQLRYLAAISCALEAVGLVVLLLAKSLPLVYVYVFTFGPGYGSLAILFPSIVGAYFGRRSYALIFGTLLAAGYVFGAISPIFAGYIFDTSGSYVVPFSVAAGLCALSAIASFFARPPTLREAAHAPSAVP